MLNDLKQQQNRSQFSPRILASDGDGGMTRDQAIGNDALAGALVPWSGSVSWPAQSGGFAVPLAWTTLTTLTVPVPAGFTRMLITTCVVGAIARNTGTQVDWLYAKAVPNADHDDPSGWVISSPDVPPGATGPAFDNNAFLMVNLSGSFTVDLQVRTGIGPWSYDASNAANLAVSGLFLR
jgi:hypothetical protein